MTRLAGTPFGLDQVRAAALTTRMFPGSTLPWECGHDDQADVDGLGRTWRVCAACGWMLDPVDRDLILGLVKGSS